MYISTNQIVAFNGETYVVKGVVTEEFAVLLNTHSTSNTYVYAPTKHLKHIPQLDESEAWIETALLVGDMVRYTSLTPDGETMRLDEEKKKNIRMHCYQLLGGNNIVVNEQTKSRVRDLIRRAEERAAY